MTKAGKKSLTVRKPTKEELSDAAARRALREFNKGLLKPPGRAGRPLAVMIVRD